MVVVVVVVSSPRRTYPTSPSIPPSFLQPLTRGISSPQPLPAPDLLFIVPRGCESRPPQVAPLRVLVCP